MNYSGKSLFSRDGMKERKKLKKHQRCNSKPMQTTLRKLLHKLLNSSNKVNFFLLLFNNNLKPLNITSRHQNGSISRYFALEKYCLITKSGIIAIINSKLRVPFFFPCFVCGYHEDYCRQLKF